jgi:hypothetical protein
MKEYDVKYDIGQRVKVIQNKRILETAIESVRINHVRPFTELTSAKEIKQNNGIKIEYLVAVYVDNVQYKNYKEYEWIDQDNICLNDEELIRKMTVIN